MNVSSFKLDSELKWQWQIYKPSKNIFIYHISDNINLKNTWAMKTYLEEQLERNVDKMFRKFLNEF